MTNDLSTMSKEALRVELLKNPRKRNLLNAYKNKLDSLTTNQFETVIGLLLGDVSLQTQNKGKTFRLKFEQSHGHLDYINHLYEKFSEWCLSKPRFQERINANGNTVTSWTFQTISHPASLPFADIFLVRNAKTGKYTKSIAKDFVVKHLTPTSMAYWFMDDGGKADYTRNQGKGFAFNCHGFPEKQVEYLVEGLRSRYKVDCWKRKNKGKYIVVISGHYFSQVMNLIGKLVISSLRGKFPSPRCKKESKADDIV